MRGERHGAALLEVEVERLPVDRVQVGTLPRGLLLLVESGVDPLAERRPALAKEALSETPLDEALRAVQTAGARCKGLRAGM